MAEPRRVSLTTLPVSAPLLKKKKEEDDDDEEEEEGEKVKTGGISAITSRHTLPLFESSEKSCPEFYYPELMRVRKVSKHWHSRLRVGV